MAQATPATFASERRTIDYYQLIGVLLAAVLPAIFWSALTSWLLSSVGISVSLAATCVLALLIAGFLSVIFLVLSGASRCEP